MVFEARSGFLIKFFIMLSMNRMIEFREISILSWNIRGASSAKAKRHITDVIRKFKPTFLFVMEIHVRFDRTKAFWN